MPRLRKKPDDFRAVYIATGWQGIGRHYRTGWEIIARWIDEEGRDELVAARAAYVRDLEEGQRQFRARQRMAALGQTDPVAEHIRKLGAPRPCDVNSARHAARIEQLCS